MPGTFNKSSKEKPGRSVRTPAVEDGSVMTSAMEEGPLTMEEGPPTMEKGPPGKVIIKDETNMERTMRR